MISLLVLVLLSVVVVGGAHAHPSTIRQRTLQERDNVRASSSSSVCPISPNYGHPCNVATQDGKVCDYDYAYMGDCGATEEELECLPFMTCTCIDGRWDCDLSDEEGMVFCPDNGNTVRGYTCTPPLSTSSVTDGDDEAVENANDSTLPQQDSDSADNSSDTNNDGIDLLDIEDNNFGSKNTVDNGNDIDSVEVTTPAVVDDNDSSTTFTVKGESEGGTRSLSSSSSSSSSSQQGLVVVKIAMVASATVAAGITLYL